MGRMKIKYVPILSHCHAYVRLLVVILNISHCCFNLAFKVINVGHLGCVWFRREDGKREIGKREFVKRERDEK